MKLKKSHITISLLVLILTLTVAGIINQSFNPQNELEIPKTSAGEITVVSPENKTYTEPMSGYYPATYGFDNDIPGSEPFGWDVRQPDGSGFIEVDAIHAGHENVVELRKTGGGDKAQLTKNFPDNATAGTIEYWLYKDTDSGIDPTRMVLGGEDGSLQFGIQSGDLYRGPWASRITIASNLFTVNTWHHIRVDFNLSLGWQIQLDDIWYGSDYSFPFEDTPTELYSFVIASIFSGDHPNYGVWLDSLDYSWHINYAIGDNLNEGILLGYENTTNLDWQGYSFDGAINKTIFGNTTIPFPSNGYHSIQVFSNDTSGTFYESNLRHFTVNYEPPTDITIITPENKTYTEPMSGYYPATYGFENELHETKGLDLLFLDEYFGQPPSSYTDIKVGDGPADGHMKYIAVSDSQGGTNSWGVHHIDTPQSSGTIEFYLWANNPTTVGSSTKRHFMNFRATDNTNAFRMMVYLSSEKVQYYDGSVWQDLAYTTPDTWYHHSISFDCEAGANGQFTWVVSDEQGSEIGRVDNQEFENDLNTIDEIYIGTHVSDYRGHTKWDAFGFSWDPDYDVGDNINEGLLLGYDSSVSLDWQGFSLDGANNKTIVGNKTIPVPVNGTHTIQVFGNDSIGTMYESNLRYFTYGTTSFPKITIISPTPDEFFSNNAPGFQLSILGASINTTWYTIDGGLTNITFSGLTGTIDQMGWDILANGVVNLRFYINNTMGNSSYSEVSIYKDTVAPIVTINSPLEYELFGKSPPSFDLSVVELNISSMWYSLDGGSTNITFQELTGTINQNEWDKYGNGTVSINFYVKDEADNEGSAQVTVRKEATPPLITINSPNDNDLFTTIAPSFDITIEELDLDTTWYTLDDGVTNYIFSGLTGSINQAEWDKFGSGNITLKFYANDSYGFENFAQVTVQKDIGPPVITIISPEQGAVFSSIAPSFNITVFDSQLDSMWYTIDNGLTNITIVSTVGTIDQIEWDKKGEGSVPLRFYANDTIGNVAYSEVVVIKNVFYGIDPIELLTPSAYSQLTSNLLEFSWYSLDAGFGAVNFTLQVSNVSDFSFIIFQSADIAETPIVTNFSVPLSITYGQFYWRVRPTYGNYNGSWSDYFLFTLHTNNYSPNLVLDDITPTEGTSSTIFRFTVIYSDVDNNVPEYVEILINGISYSMEMVHPLDEDFTDGCMYQYITLLTPSTTAYTISFECSDGAFQYATSTYQGPLVEPDSTPSLNQGDNDLNSANTFAITMTLGITIGILIPFIVFAEIKVRKMKLGEKSSTKIKKKEIKS